MPMPIGRPSPSAAERPRGRPPRSSAPCRSRPRGRAGSGRDPGRSCPGSRSTSSSAGCRSTCSPTRPIGPILRLTSWTMSLTATTWSSYAAGGERNWKRSWPLCAATSAAALVGKLGEVDVVDHHLGVVLLAPRLHVLVVEPAVVRRHEVAPLHDPERPGQLLAAVLRHGRDRALDAGRRRRRVRPPRARPCASRSRRVSSSISGVTWTRSLSSLTAYLLSCGSRADLPTFDQVRQRNAPPVNPAMKRSRNML